MAMSMRADGGSIPPIATTAERWASDETEQTSKYISGFHPLTYK